MTCDPVGIRDIAARLGVKPNTPSQWRLHGLLPEPRWQVSGSPTWEWADIEAWAISTNRLPKKEQSV